MTKSIDNQQFKLVRLNSYCGNYTLMIGTYKECISHMKRYYLENTFICNVNSEE